ncbi:Antirestriction protein [Shigella sonnei]|nr:Antirestriction protein [Shigella sonnei]
MSVVAPAVYVGTWHKYNCGSIAGRWFDLTTFDDERDFFAACRALHQDEADPELMFQDYEGFPGNMASECHINWAWVEGFRLARDEGCEEAYRLWVEDTGETDFDTFRDAWWGEADSEEAFAVEFASDTAVPCLHKSRAIRWGCTGRKGRGTAAVTRSLLPVCRDFPVVHPLRFRGLTLQLPSAVRVRLRLPLRPCNPAGPAKMEARHRPVSRNM